MLKNIYNRAVAQESAFIWIFCGTSYLMSNNAWYYQIGVTMRGIIVIRVTMRWIIVIRVTLWGILEIKLKCTRETCSCSQTAVQWNQWRWSIHKYSNGGEHYSDNKLPHMNIWVLLVTQEARNRTQQHTDSTKLAVLGWDRTYNALISILLSQRISQLCQPFMVGIN